MKVEFINHFDFGKGAFKNVRRKLSATDTQKERKRMKHNHTAPLQQLHRNEKVVDFRVHFIDKAMD